MKFAFAVFAIFAMFVCFVSSIPIEQDSEGEAILHRDRRATCDLLSFDTKFGSLNHSACAAHCLFKGYKGGRCKNAICHCRN